MSGLGKGVTKVAGGISKHSPLILTILGATSVVSTAFFAAKASMKATDILKKYDEKLKDEKDPDAIKNIKRNRAVDIGKLYLPAIINGALGIVCIIGAHKIHTSRQLALAATCALTEKKFEDYKESVEDFLDDNQNKEFKEKVANDKLNSEEFKSMDLTANLGGEVLYYDDVSNNKFYAPPEKLQEAINEFNAMRMAKPLNEFTLSDFCDILGVPCGVLGTVVGWPAYGDSVDNHIMADIDCDYEGIEDKYGRVIPAAVIVYRNMEVLHDDIY